jgi:hypothetical protein
MLEGEIERGMLVGEIVGFLGIGLFLGRGNFWLIE